MAISKTASSYGGGGSTSSVTPSQKQQIVAIWAQAHVPSWIWVTILGAESGGHAGVVAYTPTQSVGLYQLDTVSGQGRGYSVAYLQNPVNNARIAAKYIGPAYQKCLLSISKTMDGMPTVAMQEQLLTCTAKNSGHAGLVAPYSNDLIDVFNNMKKGQKYNGWGFNTLGAVIGNLEVVKSAEKAVNSLNPVKSAESFISKNWVTWLMVAGLVIIIILLLYKGIVG